MNAPKLTQEEIDSLISFTFKKDDSMPEDKYDKQCNDTAKKIYAILLDNTNLQYPPKVLRQISEAADKIKTEEIKLKVIDHNNPENNIE